jgi:hypothetical protein
MANVQSFNLSSTATISDDPSPPGDGLDSTVGLKAEELVAKIKVLRAKVHKQRTRRKRAEQALSEMREKMLEQQTELRERNKSHNALLDYFNLLYLAIKINATEEGKYIDMNGAQLYDEAVRQDIPWNHWVVWLPHRIDELAAASKVAPRSPLTTRRK